MRRFGTSVRFLSGFALCLGIGLLGASPALSVCTPTQNPAVAGEYLGCCDPATNDWKAAGSTCIDPNQSCRKGVCSSNVCVQPGGGWVGFTTHQSCNNPGNPCLRGECYNKQCQGIGNGTDYDATCPADGKVCTNDCAPNNATTDTPLDVVCAFTNLANGTDCSIGDGSATCTKGDCDGNGNCVPSTDTFTCSGSLGICKRFECIPGSIPTCTIVPKDVGTICEDPYLPLDCHKKECNSNGTCRDRGGELAGNICEDGDGNSCTRGQCNTSKACQNVVGLADGESCDDDGNACTDDLCDFIDQTHSNCTHPADPTQQGNPCASDNQLCTQDICDNAGHCTHPADLTKNGQSCTNWGNTCAATSECQNGLCTTLTCNSTGNCNNCGSFPACTNNPPTCGCN